MKFIAAFKYTVFFLLIFLFIGETYAADHLLFDNNNKLITRKDSIISDIKKRGNSIKKGYFIENKGQLADSNGKVISDILFYGSTGGVQFYIKKNGISYIFLKSEDSLNNSNKLSKLPKNDLLRKKKVVYRKIDMEIVGADFNTGIVKNDTVNEYYNYFLDHCPNGLTNVRNFNNIEFTNILPNIDMILYMEGENMKYDFIVHPGGDPNNIQMKFFGQDNLKIDKDGNLIVKSSLGYLEEKAPFSYQVADNNKRKIQSKFLVNNNLLSFDIENYNKNEILIIDPTRFWGTYYGGADTDEPKDIVYDKNGYIYIVGTTTSMWLGTNFVHQKDFNENTTFIATDIFISKFDRNGEFKWTTYYGGNISDEGNAIDIDKNGNLYIVGTTSSIGANINITNSGIVGRNSTSYCIHSSQLGNGSGFDVVIAKFNSAGIRMWGTYFGGDFNDFGNDISVDDNYSSIYITGSTASTNGISTTTCDLKNLNNSSTAKIKIGGNDLTIDAFLTQFDMNGCQIWGTYLGDNQIDHSKSVTHDTKGGIYITGDTYANINSSGTIITNNAFQTTYGGGSADAFISKFDRCGNLIWSTFLGGNDADYGNSIASDLNGHIYICGNTASSSNIATSGTYSNTHSGSYDGFVVKFNEFGERIWGTYLGGANTDILSEINIIKSSQDRVMVIGSSNSNNYPITYDAYQINRSGGYDAVFAEFNSDNGNLITSTFYGGEDDEFGRGVAFDGNNNVYIVGDTKSGGVTGCNGHFSEMSSLGAFQEIKNTSIDGFIANFSSDTYEKHNKASRPKISGALISLDNNCSYNILTVNFDKYIRNNSIEINDFTITGNPSRIIQSITYPSGVDYTKTFTMNISPAIEKDELLDLNFTGFVLDNLGITASNATIPISIEYTGFNITTNAEALNCELSEITLCAPANFAGPYVWTKDGNILYDAANPTLYSGNCITVKGAGKYSVSILHGSNCRLIAEPVIIH